MQLSYKGGWRKFPAETNNVILGYTKDRRTSLLTRVAMKLQILSIRPHLFSPRFNSCELFTILHFFSKIILILVSPSQFLSTLPNFS
jgi:hypothetical protein